MIIFLCILGWILLGTVPLFLIWWFENEPVDIEIFFKFIVLGPIVLIVLAVIYVIYRWGDVEILKERKKKERYKNERTR